MGKAIYEPKGKAGEYADYACNFFTGCSNDCSYCYNKRGVLAHTWDVRPRLKSCFKDKDNAIKTFQKECSLYLEHLIQKGLFFTFTSDPCLPETLLLNFHALKHAVKQGVNCTLLTKSVNGLQMIVNAYEKSGLPKGKLAIGFTLTGHDELEPHASTNQQRIDAMRDLHSRGFKTWASIEPVVDTTASMLIINATLPFCDLYKIGLQSGVKKSYYEDSDLQFFLEEIKSLKGNFYLKDSIVERLGLNRDELAAPFVGKEFSLFTNNR